MLVLLKSKLQGQRSGNGRECNLRGKLASGDGSSAGDAKTVMTGRTVGEIAQALAWEKNSKALFGKSPGTKTTMTSVSTSPETDPGSSDLFPFFREDEACIGGEGDEDDRDSLQSGRSRGTNESNDGVRWRRPAARKPEYQNPLFHMPLLSDSQREAAQSSATASIFPRAETPREAMAVGNPMFCMTNRMASEGVTVPKPQPKKNKEVFQEKSAKSSTYETEEERSARKGKIKKEKAAYEHVGRTDVRSTSSGLPNAASKSGSSEAGGPRSERPKAGTSPGDASKSSTSHGQPSQRAHAGFRVDSFARNEGENRTVAHFKFVFTLKADDGTSVECNRLVLDVVHERLTGQVKVKVNDGRMVTAIGRAVEVTVDGIGRVLFDPKVQTKGHHWYTLRLGSKRLFSVLA